MVVKSNKENGLTALTAQRKQHQLDRENDFESVLLHKWSLLGFGISDQKLFTLVVVYLDGLIQGCNPEKKDEAKLMADFSWRYRADFPGQKG